MRNVEGIIQERDKYRSLAEKSNEALLTYSNELKKLRKFLAETGGNELDDEGKDQFLKKVLKTKELEEDNRKLRKLLKTQLENSENLRMETQNTVETLREEFDLLVKELVTYKKKEAEGGYSNNPKTLPGTTHHEGSKGDNKNKRDSTGSSGMNPAKKEDSKSGGVPK
eukprot:CAMPEP_0170544382 /NCGR_PEP_ID=MMETSP0211-20121228/3165_1 /TAXON_ID=311385 /ORGANISM="Pseudokeronopsis sp., Strain OXSARD2" /LENGTH=167 /DNA_ID=CAMNT_0010848015 /DNA_START=244 /DNA_END=744 /DNA_ORIENTATION=+